MKFCFVPAQSSTLTTKPHWSTQWVRPALNPFKNILRDRQVAPSQPLLSAMPHEFARLPTSVKPLKYKVNYDVIDLVRFRFEGREEIAIAVQSATNMITCHAIELWVYNVKVVLEDGSIVASLETRFIEEDQTVTFVLERELPQGSNAMLHLTFKGLLNNDLRGFYRSEYEYEGQKRFMAASQFQACDARRAFVCWDEPAIKATFEISMTTPANLTAISNMHVLSTSVVAGSALLPAEKVWHFAESPVMSTYLVALVVGEFDCVSDYTDEGVLVNIYCPLGKADQGKFALSVATKSLSFFTKAFGLQYPLKKLDNLAIPDFAAGAMENWGCILYREAALLIEPGQTSKAKKTQVALTVAHELAHQWFGNLVTMEWWTGLWLNEGFAHFMEYDAVDHIFPEWKMWENFVQEVTLDSALREDALLSSHMIEVEVNHPDEADEIFDAISYCKGSSVIRMICEYLGKDVFYKGIQIYLKRYGNAVTVDLWNALEEASSLPLTTMMNTWTKQTGFPVVTLSHLVNGQFALSQTRFLSDPTIKDPDNSMWGIALTGIIAHGSTPTSAHLGIWSARDQPSRNAAFEIHAPPSVVSQLPSSAQWIKLNASQQGFFIDNYDSEGWRRLQAPCKDLILSDVDRLCLVDNSFVLTRAGKLTLTDALDFSRAFAADPTYIIWQSLSTHLGFYSELFSRESFLPKLQSYIRGFFGPQLQRLTWFAQDSDIETTPYFRRELIRMLGGAKDPAVVAEAITQFQSIVTNPSASKIASDLRAAVFRIAGTQLQEQAYDSLRSLHETTNLPEVKNDCLVGLGAVKSKWNETLEWAIAGNVRSQDIRYAFAGVVNASLDGADFAWNFIQTHWDVLNEKYIPTLVGTLVCSAVNKFYTEVKANEVAVFFQDKKTSAFKRRLDNALENVRTRSICFQRDVKHMETWLNDHSA
ncbi:hypothetical protein Ae201684P_008232 [Aphanomyces euteiches]|nr:hypothetical protein Ae201684P_008232 [Aphanomyces euteiches]